MSGVELCHNKYEQPIFGDQGVEGEFIYADYVTLEDGTGVVHSAPGHGVDDYNAGMRFGIPVVMPVDDDGVFQCRALLQQPRVTAQPRQLADVVERQPHGVTGRLQQPGQVLAFVGRGNKAAVLQILLALAGTVDVPQQDLDQHRASVVPREDSEQMPFHIRSGEQPPEDAYAAVSYRNRWFWIDDTDYRSKRAFSLIMFLFTLSEEGDNQRLPVLTIPTG